MAIPAVLGLWGLSGPQIVILLIEVLSGEDVLAESRPAGQRNLPGPLGPLGPQTVIFLIEAL